jgi:hypothetical protein
VRRWLPIYKQLLCRSGFLFKCGIYATGPMGEIQNLEGRASDSFVKPYYFEVKGTPRPRRSALAVGAVVGTPPGKEDTADRGPAGQAGQAGSQVDAVLELEEAGDPVCVDIVRDRGAAEFDGFPKDGLQRGAKAVKPVAGEASGHAGGADSGVEETLVGVDVADAVEQLLVEQGGLDGEPAVAKEGAEVGGGDGEGFVAGSAEWLGVRDRVQGEAAEAARVDETELASGGERKDGVRVRRKRDIGRGDEESSGHPEVDDPLSRSGVSAAFTKVEYDVLADAVNALNALTGKGFGHLGWRILERFLVAAKPYGPDAVPAGAFVHTARDGFDFREFGHAALFSQRPRECVQPHLISHDPQAQIR